MDMLAAHSEAAVEIASFSGFRRQPQSYSGQVVSPCIDAANMRSRGRTYKRSGGLNEGILPLFRNRRALSEGVHLDEIGRRSPPCCGLDIQALRSRFSSPSVPVLPLEHRCVSRSP